MRVGVQLHTPATLSTAKRPSTYCIAGRAGTRAGLDECGKSPPPRIQSPDRPACSELLYWLCYPVKVSLPISRHLCQDTISLLPNLHSNSDETANQLSMLLPELSMLKKQNKGGVWLQGIHITMTVTVNTVGNLVLRCQYFKNRRQIGAPTASVGSTNPAGWSDERLFFV
jgi:hypothetical protein